MNNSFTLTAAMFMEMMGNVQLKNVFILYNDRRKTCRRQQFSHTGFMDVKKGNISEVSISKQDFH